MAAHTKGFMFPFQEIQEVLPKVEYFHPKRSKDWGGDVVATFVAFKTNFQPSLKTSSQ